MYVKEADKSNSSGSVRKITENFFVGFIDRFADYSRANEYSRQGWELLLKSYNALK